MSSKLESKNGNMSIDLESGDMAMKNINKDFPKVFVGKERD